MCPDYQLLRADHQLLRAGCYLLFAECDLLSHTHDELLADHLLFTNRLCDAVANREQ